MKVIKAQTAGFCFGVKRAVDQVYDLAAKEKEPVYTYGPIIHNEEVVRDLEEKRRTGAEWKRRSAFGKKGYRCDPFPWRCGRGL